MTNADKVRNMSDEELAVWLEKALCGGNEGFDKWLCDRCQNEHGGACPLPGDERCKKADNVLLYWLKAAAEN